MARACSACPRRSHYLGLSIRTRGQVDDFALDAFLRGFLGFPLSVDPRGASRVVVLPPLGSLTRSAKNR